MNITHLAWLVLCVSQLVLGNVHKEPQGRSPGMYLHRKPAVRTVSKDGFQLTNGGNVGSWLIRILSGNRFACGGSYYSSLYVLTSANCMHHYKNNLDMLSVELVTPKADQTNAFGLIDTVIVPKQFSWPSNFMDVAVVKLLSPLPGYSSDFVQLCKQPLHDDMKLTVVACGAAADEELRMEQISVENKGKCVEEYRDFELAETLVCAKEHNRPMECTFDFGCPVTSNDELCGIVAWGPECNDKQKPGLFTDIGQVKSFIRKAINPTSHRKLTTKQLHRTWLRK